MRDKKDCMVRIFNFHKLLIIIKAATFAMLLPLRYYVRMPYQNREGIEETRYLP